MMSIANSLLAPGSASAPDREAKHTVADESRYSDEESQFPGPPENEPAYVFVLLEHMTPPFPNNYKDLLTKLRMCIPAIQEWRVFLQVRQISSPFFQSIGPLNIRSSSDPSISTPGTSVDCPDTNGSTLSPPLQLTVYKTPNVSITPRTLLATIQKMVSSHWGNKYQVMLMNDMLLIPPY